MNVSGVVVKSVMKRVLFIRSNLINVKLMNHKIYLIIISQNDRKSIIIILDMPKLSIYLNLTKVHMERNRSDILVHNSTTIS